MIKKDNDEVDSIFNDGERLVPFLSHNIDELVRHFSSHNFFKQIIQKDIQMNKLKQLSILDLGAGTGYASFIYANLKQVATIKSIDVDEDSLRWAKENYHNEKIEYEVCDAVEFLKRDEKFSYIVTRHVLEHIENGLSIIDESKFNNRLCINVPYKETKGNIYHSLTGITENDFPHYKNVEFFYEDLNGITYNTKPTNVRLNSIICIASKGKVPKVNDYFQFPIRAATLEEIFHTLSKDNFNFVKNILEIQTKRAINLKINESRQLALAEENKQLKRDISSLRKELSDIYNSKKWRVVEKAADIKQVLLPSKHE